MSPTRSIHPVHPASDIHERLHTIQCEAVTRADALLALGRLVGLAAEQPAEFCQDVMSGLGSLIETHARAVAQDAEALDRLWLELGQQGGKSRAA